MADNDPSHVQLRNPVGALGWLEAMADALPMLIAYIDRDHRYRFNNRAYEEWFGRCL